MSADTIPVRIGQYQQLGAGQEAAPPLVRFSIDHCVPLPGRGLFLWGWYLDAASEWASFRFSTDQQTWTELLDADYVPVPRRDVVRAFASSESSQARGTNERCGFAFFLRGSVEASQSDGETGSAVPALHMECRAAVGPLFRLRLDRSPSDEEQCSGLLRDASHFVLDVLAREGVERLDREWTAAFGRLRRLHSPSPELSHMASVRATALFGGGILLQVSWQRDARADMALSLISEKGQFASLRCERLSATRWLGLAEQLVVPAEEPLCLIGVTAQGIEIVESVRVEDSSELSYVELRSWEERLRRPEVSAGSRRPPQQKREQSADEELPVVRFSHLFGRTVVGWATHRFPSGPVELELRAGGSTRLVVADRRERTLGFGEHRASGFEWSLPHVSWNEAPVTVRAYHRGSPEPCAEFPLGPGLYDGQLVEFFGGILRGWVRERVAVPSPPELELTLDGEPLAKALCDQPPPSQLAGLLREPCGFSVPVPGRFLDGRPRLVRGSVAGTELFHAWIESRVTGAVDVLHRNLVAGWAEERQSSGIYPLALDLYVAGERVAAPMPRVFRSDLGRESGFHFDIASFTRMQQSFEVGFRLAGTETPVLDGPLHCFERHEQVRLLQTLVRSLTAGELPPASERPTLAALLPALIEDTRRTERSQRIVSVRPVRRRHRERPVTVIIPIYDGLAETLRCVTSVFESRAANRTAHRILLIDDAGPDPRLRARLRRFVEEPDVSWIENERNLGFVQSVNRGMQRSWGHDVVLLNADTAVSGNWLDRLKKALDSDDTIASVTPLSNNATICSYPHFCHENEMPRDVTLRELDEMCARVNANVRVELPTAVGFCMLIQAEALERIGFFHEKWGRGYGEENDWCLRARDQGFVHVLAADVFVEHSGGASFGVEQKSGLVEKNLKLLSEQYPEYQADIHRFVETDPVRTARNRVTMARLERRLARHPGPTALFVLHDLGGGIQTHCEEMKRRLEMEGVEVLTLKSNDEGWVLVHEDLRIASSGTDLSELAAGLSRVGLAMIHVHSDIGFEDELWSLPEKLGCPLFFTLHDYVPLCPRVNMVDAASTYCGAPTEASVCSACVRSIGAYPLLEGRFLAQGSDVGAWRARYLKRLRSARRLFAPNQDVAQRVARYFPELPIRVVPHPSHRGGAKLRIAPRVTSPTVRVAVIGAIGQHKGFSLLVRCANDAVVRGLPLEFLVVGFTCDDASLHRYPNVTITGRYEPSELPRLLSESGARSALFLSKWPETHSYTLSEALAAELYPVLFDIGAPAERLRALGIGRVLPFEAGPREVNDALLECAREKARDVEWSEGQYESLLRDYYGFEAG